MADPNIDQAIKLAKAGEPAEMKNSIYAALTKKVGDALDLKKISVASSMFGNNDESEPGAEQEEESDG